MFEATVLGAELYYVLWFFYIYCFLGVFVEMIFCYAQEGVIESRVGLLYLPLSPIYGFGSVLLSVFLLPYFSSPLVLFFVGIAVGTILEYVASFLMEKAFGTVFWDYSDQPLNVQGRVCLRYSIYWGLLSLLLLYVLDRMVLRFVDTIPRTAGEVILVAVTVLTLVSTALTLAAFTRYKHKVAALEAARSGAEADLADNPVSRAIDRLVPDPIMINTFPRMSLVTQYMDLTGLERRWIRPQGHLGTPSEIHQRMRARRELEHAAEGGPA